MAFMNGRASSNLLPLALSGVLIIVAMLLGARVITDAKTIRELRDEQVVYEQTLNEELSHDDTASDQPVALPVIAFSPAGKFTDAERELLWQRVITPHTNYSECMGERVAAIIIEKRETPKVIANTTYLYDIRVYSENSDGSQNAVYEGFLHGEVDGEMDYWVPAMRCAIGPSMSTTGKLENPDCCDRRLSWSGRGYGSGTVASASWWSKALFRSGAIRVPSSSPNFSSAPSMDLLRMYENRGTMSDSHERSVTLQIEVNPISISRRFVS